MTRRTAQGFTLIELLTVIAIIAILAGLTYPALSRAVESARIRAARSTMQNLGTAMTAYLGASQTNSYPAIYGYRRWEERTNPNPFNPGNGKTLADVFVLKPYMDAIGLHMVEDNYDPYSSGYDTNMNSPSPHNYPEINILEWGPAGRKDPISGALVFPQNELYLGAYTSGTVPSDLTGELRSEYDRTSEADSRPFVYVPVNTAQAKRVNAYYQSILRDKSAPMAKRLAAAVAGIWEPENAQLSQLSFPPPRYDTYVLISVGPSQNTGGVVCGADIPGQSRTLPPEDIYHITALRAYWLATRDLNETGVPDFDYQGRPGDEVNVATYMGKGFDDVASQVVQLPGGKTGPAMITLLPDGTGGRGPLIYVVK